MAELVLEREQYLPRPIDEVFEFFAQAENLDYLTPPWLHFRIVTPRPIILQQGAVIDYRIRWRWLPVRWRSVITAWDPPHGFVDEQVRGPYKFWHHTHSFVAKEEGTLMTDRVRYRLRCAPFSNFMQKRVASDLELIFDYRRQRIADFYSAPIITPSAAKMLEGF
ncbi:MAG TPA: SRPBCC family protein [Gemmatales bacterium]|mgnify:FL=1|nr:SRPBCC family protein [Gemmatales bacterium]